MSFLQFINLILNFDKLLKDLFNSKRKSNKVKQILIRMLKKKEIDQTLSLFILKITIIILSYYPEKRNLIYKFYTNL